MSTRTDLAKEIIDKNFPEYSKKKTFFRGETKITRILIETDADAEKIEKPKGRYVDMEADSIRFPYGKFDGEAFALAEELAELLPEKGDILLVGLGNRNLTADSLGVMTAEKAIRILEGLPRGWFPYKMPSWANDVTDYDYEMYEICCAIWFAIDKLKDGE